MAGNTTTLSPEWWKRLEGAGIVPKMVRRMVIDVNLDEPVKVYFECYGDDALLGVVPTLLDGARIVRTTELPLETG